MNCKKLLPLPLTLALLAGCATQPKESETLTMARQVVAEASQNPAVERFAPLALQQAQETLNLAEAAWRSQDIEAAEHRAYLALKRGQIAQALARRDQVILSGFQASDQQQQALLQERERQARQAMTAAERARREAEQARQQAMSEAERARQQAEQARQRYQEQLEQQRAELERARGQLAELEPKQTERGIELTLDEVLFPFNSAELQPGNERTIQRLAQFLQASPDAQILIEGHTDAVGTDQYNQQLSEQRAESVRQALSRHGIGRERVRSVGLGEGFPVASNQNPEGRAQNRRVEVVIAQGEIPPTREEVQQAGSARERQGQPQG
jgi:outer membrane protein OmpA-like peptidoglycan-associated protein